MHFYNFADMFLIESIEDNDVVDAIQKFGAEVFFELCDDFLSLFFILEFFCSCFIMELEANFCCLTTQFFCPNITCHDNNGVGEVHAFSVSVRQHSIF